MNLRDESDGNVLLLINIKCYYYGIIILKICSRFMTAKFVKRATLALHLVSCETKGKSDLKRTIQNYTFD